MATLHVLCAVFWMCVLLESVTSEEGIAAVTENGNETQGLKNGAKTSFENKTEIEEETTNNQTEAENYLKELDEQFSKECNAYMKARWAYMTNITKENSKAMEEAGLKFEVVKQEARNKIAKDYSDWNNASIYTEVQVRQFKYYRNMGTGMKEEDLQKMNGLLAEMETIFSTAKISPYTDGGNGDLSLNPDLIRIMAQSRNYSELLHVWKSWRDMTGKRMRQQYIQFVNLSNTASATNGFADTSEYWLQPYEHKDFSGVVHDLWTKEHDLDGQQGSLKDFYEQLHAFVRKKLYQYYGKDKVKKYGAIPAHILGNMWAQNWVNIEDMVQPYTLDADFDVTEAMLQQNYTSQSLFDVADKFFQQLDFDPMTQVFKEKSMIEKPADREVVCHSSAEDFCMGKKDGDYRIKMCTEVNHQNLITVHHEMGHIQYFMEYKNQPFVFREGANPGFHEAIGDTIALTINSPFHLVHMGLINSTELLEAANKREDQMTKEDEDDEAVTTSTMGEESVSPNGKLVILSNLEKLYRKYLFRMALEKVAFLPFAYVMDSWRWGVFRGEITEENMNEKWWELRKRIQGVAPPVKRTEDDFDPGAKYHIAANVPYIRYFVSFILQFQFYEHLCIEAGQYDPRKADSRLFLCDFSNNRSATKKFREMLRKGFSQKWQDTLQQLTGKPDISTKPLLTYFKDIYLSLRDKNKYTNVGWGAGNQATARKELKGKLLNVKRALHDAVVDQWQYYTHITPGHAEVMADSEEELAKKRVTLCDKFISFYDWEDFIDDQENTRRQMRLMSMLGVSALPADKLAEFSKVTSSMTSTYSKAKICPYEKQDCDVKTEGLPFSPDLRHILSHSNDYKELAYVWREWRKATGAKLKEYYVQYVNLSNEAAQANSLNDMGDLWLASYESDTFQEEVKSLWEEVEPLYRVLHAFVRLKLQKRYKEHMAGERMPIPAHVLGNMWSQSWGNILGLVTPFPDASSAQLHVTEQLVKQNRSIQEMYEIANEFFMSLKLENMSVAFDEERAMIEKPPDRAVVCHPSAWDFYDGKDFRIKMCTKRTMEDLVTIHHEMGHIQYYMQYKKQPLPFLDGANPGFHEAIGDVIALSAQTPDHMKMIGLLPDYYPTHESDMNYLLMVALEKLTFLPFAYVVDLWRWNVFNGTFAVEDWNREWWRLREKYQGIIPPESRGEDDLDALAKYHVAADVPYIRYFVSHILQFEFHKALCIEAKEYDPYNRKSKPLYKCDIYRKEAAGAKLKKLLESGLSQHWRDVLYPMTGSRNMNASALLEYFEPLRDLLRRHITDNDLGWDSYFENYMSPDTTTKTSNIVPIAVGAVLAALVLIVLIAYFIGRTRINKKNEDI